MIRRAELFDVPALAKMEQQYIECPYSSNVLTATISDPQSKIFLLIVNNIIVAYGGYKLILDTSEIFNIVVDQQYRRQGYAKQILQHIILDASASCATEMFLEVNQNNSVAIELYKSFGFKQISIRKNYYKSGNAIIMKKELRF